MVYCHRVSNLGDTAPSVAVFRQPVAAFGGRAVQGERADHAAVDEGGGGFRVALRPVGRPRFCSLRIIRFTVGPPCGGAQGTAPRVQGRTGPVRQVQGFQDWTTRRAVRCQNQLPDRRPENSHPRGSD